MAENNGCLLENTALDIMAAIMESMGEHVNDPLCRPLKVSTDDMTQMQDEYAAAVSVSADLATRGETAPGALNRRSGRSDR
jgi:hypothetical protein